MSESVGRALRLMPALLLTALLLLTDARSVLAAGNVAVVSGYRVDNLDWNIAGDNSGHNPNILSELNWSDLRIYQIGVTGSLERVSTDTTFLPYLRAAVGYGQIVSGDNQDSDYDGDDRTLEFSRSNNSADDGNVIDLSLGGGNKFHFRDRRFTLIPLVGFSYYAQNLTMTDGNQTIPNMGPFDRLDSTYETAWYGTWLGLDAMAVPVTGWTLNAGIETHLLTYRAEANWNLRPDFAHPRSFEHDGNGYGLICRLGSDYALTPRWHLTVAADLRNFIVRNGSDRIYFADGSQVTTRLNEVNWDSKMLTAGVLYHF